MFLINVYAVGVTIFSSYNMSNKLFERDCFLFSIYLVVQYDQDNEALPYILIYSQVCIVRPKFDHSF